jgi:regulatory protein
LDSKSISSVEVVLQKLEYFCSYQERCHVEVIEKLRGFAISDHQKQTIIVRLIEHNFLNEERFASVFTISKFHQKKWGKIRIKNELKARKIAGFLIQKSIKEIPDDEYQEAFEVLAEKQWQNINENNPLKKRKKFCDYLLRNGWESELIYQKVKELEQ